MPEYKIDSSLIAKAEEQFTRTIRNREEVELIILHSAGRKDLFEDLIFTSKYMAGLLRASSRSDHGAGDILTREIADSVSKLRVMLFELLGEKFEGIAGKYFTQDTESFFKLTSLASDLELLKLYINRL